MSRTRSETQRRWDVEAMALRHGFDGALELYAAGRPAEARDAWLSVVARIDGLEEAALREDPWVRAVKADATYNVACMHGVLGERERALGALEQALALGFSAIAELEKDLERELRDVRDDPRCAAVVSEVRLRADKDGGRGA